MKIYFLYLINMSKLSIETAKNSVNYKAFTEEQLQYLDYERMNETITKITFPTKEKQMEDKYYDYKSELEDILAYAEKRALLKDNEVMQQDNLVLSGCKRNFESEKQQYTGSIICKKE